MKRAKRAIVLVVLALVAALSFTLAACNSQDRLTLLSPQDGATGVSTLPLITWSADSSAEWYELKISENSDFSDYAVYETPLEGTSYQVKSGLKNETKYYLQLKACSENYTAEVTSSFTTKAFEPDEDRDVAVDETIFSFDYADQSALEAAWTMHGGGDPVTMTLVDSPLANGDSGNKAVRVEYQSDNSGGKSRQGWTQAYAKVDDDKYVWDKRAGVKFYLESDGSGTTFRFLFVERIDDYFYVDIQMNTEYKGYVTVPFSSFVLDTDNSFGGGEMTLDAVKKVCICTVGYKSGSYLIDDISIVTECEDNTYLVERGETDSLVYDDFSAYADTDALREVWYQLPEADNGNPTLETDHLGNKAMKIEQGTSQVLSDKDVSLAYYNAVKITYYTLSAYNLEIASYIANQGDFAGKVALEACTDDNYKTAILRVGGGGSTEVWNLQLKSIAADTYISKIEFVEDDSAPALTYTATKDSITIGSVSGAEYSIDGGATWQASNVFENLELGTYTLAIRYKATASFGASQAATKEVALSEITFGAPFMDNMVLQRGKPVSVWAYGLPETEYTLTFAGQTVTETSDEDGYVLFTLGAMDASTEGRTLEIAGDGSSNSISNVLVGEVWIAAGQSNMQMSMATTDYTQADIDLAASGNIRLFMQDMTTASTPQTAFQNGIWYVANEVNAKDYSAIGYMFGANLYAALGENVPVGIVYAAEGGTDIEAWISSDNYSGDKSTRHGDYNGMIAPMKGMTVGGVLWYQGENNAAWATEYADLLEALVTDWRETFNDEDLYFLVIQLPVYNSGNVNWAYLREAQQAACDRISNCDLIVTIDTGDLNNIHPTDKRAIALRCVDMAEYKLFSGAKVEYSFYQSSVRDGSSLVVTTSGDSALHADGTPAGFEIAGADGVYYPATAVLEGNTVTLTAAEVSEPVYARYNFLSVGGGNVFNSYGLPLAPFRTDTSNSLIIDDFTSYGSNEALNQYWGGSNIVNATAALTDGVQDNAMLLTATGAGAQASLAIGGSWASYKSVRVTFKVSENYGTFTFALSLGGDLYPYKVIAGNGKWQTVQFPITSMTGIDGYNGTVAYVIIKLDNGGSVIIDDITVTDSEEVIEVGPDYQDRVFENFESYADSAALVSAWSPYNAAVTLEEENGTKSMKIVNNADGAQAQFTASDDWSGYKSVSVTYKTSASGAAFQFVINPGDGTYPYIQITGNGEWQTATFKISSMTGIETYSGAVGYVMIKPVGTNNWVMIDEIRLLVEETENIPAPPAAEDFVIDDCGYADDAAVAAAVSGGKLEVSGLTLNAQDGALKVTSPGNGWQYLIFKFNATNASSYEYLEFYVDFSNYTGGEFIVQLADSSYVTYENVVDGSTNNYNYNNLKKGVYRIPLSDFTASGASAGDANLIWVNFILNDNEGGSLLLSGIRLVNADSASVPSEDLAPVDPPAEGTVFDDFESYADGSALTAVWSPYNATVTLETENGGKVMKIENTADGAQAQSPVNADWSQYTSVTFRYRTNAADVSFSVSLYYGDDAGNSYYPYYDIAGSGEWQTVTFNIADMQSLDNYTGWVGYLIVKPVGVGNWVMIDEIVLS